MLDPRLGLSTISSWTPTLDPSNTVVMLTTAVPAPHFGLDGDDGDDDDDYYYRSSHQSYWLRLIIKISILCGWFSERLTQYARLVQEACSEAAEERRLRFSSSSSASSSSSPCRRNLTLHSSSVLKPRHPKSPEQFTLFNLLPAELRQQIWEEALPRSRVLMLELPKPPFLLPYRSSSVVTGYLGQELGNNIFRCRTAAPPALLHVCSESRGVALRRYRLGLAPRGHADPRIYVCLERDVVGLSDEVMESPQGRNLLRLTPDLRTARSVCLAAGQGRHFLGTRLCGDVLGRVGNVAVVDSALFGAGMLPRVAGLDWEYWIRWQCRAGKARWMLGGEEYSEEEEEEEEAEEEEDDDENGNGDGQAESLNVTEAEKIT